MLGSSSGARTYTVRVESLLEHLRKNRAQHQEAFDKAQKIYREESKRALLKMLKAVDDGDEFSSSTGLSEPVKYLDEFDNAIGLLEMTLDAGVTTIDIDSSEYERFVRNKWSWSQRFEAHTISYLSR